MPPISTSYDHNPDDYRFKRVSNPRVEWERRLKPLRPWITIIGQMGIGMLIAAGIAMVCL